MLRVYTDMIADPRLDMARRGNDWWLDLVVWTRWSCCTFPDAIYNQLIVIIKLLHLLLSNRHLHVPTKRMINKKMPQGSAAVAWQWEFNTKHHNSLQYMHHSTFICSSVSQIPEFWVYYANMVLWWQFRISPLNNSFRKCNDHMLYMVFWFVCLFVF